MPRAVEFLLVWDRASITNLAVLAALVIATHETRLALRSASAWIRSRTSAEHTVDPGVRARQPLYVAAALEPSPPPAVAGTHASPTPYAPRTPVRGARAAHWGVGLLVIGLALVFLAMRRAEPANA